MKIQPAYLSGNGKKWVKFGGKIFCAYCLTRQEVTENDVIRNNEGMLTYFVLKPENEVHEKDCRQR